MINVDPNYELHEKL